MNPVSTPPRVVPTLTEVLIETDLELEPNLNRVSAESAASVDTIHENVAESSFESFASVPDAAIAPAGDGNDPGILQDEITQRIWLDLQYQVDKIVEYRMREALAPIMARAGDQLIREARSELSDTLKDVVARAVSQELARQRVGRGTVNSGIGGPSLKDD